MAREIGVIVGDISFERLLRLGLEGVELGVTGPCWL
jgi:hypothetical protein